MTLDEYLSRGGEKEFEFAKRINRSSSSVSRLRRGLTLPDWETMRRVATATAGAVMPNDFIPTKAGVDFTEAAE